MLAMPSRLPVAAGLALCKLPPQVVRVLNQHGVDLRDSVLAAAFFDGVRVSDELDEEDLRALGGRSCRALVRRRAERPCAPRGAELPGGGVPW
jgi:hypothetical protein